MGKKEELKTYTALVKSILIKNKKARNSDNYLYLKVVDKLNKDCVDKPFGEVMMKASDLGLPSYETISRCRRKIQENNPDLQADERVYDYRAKNQMTFEEYAKETR